MTWEMYGQDCREQGKAEGRAEGRAEGIAEGKAEGKAEGRAEGIAEGRAEGKTEGQREMIFTLIKNGTLSMDEAKKYVAFTDTELEELTSLTH